MFTACSSQVAMPVPLTQYRLPEDNNLEALLVEALELLRHILVEVFPVILINRICGSSLDYSKRSILAVQHNKLASLLMQCQVSQH